MEYGVWMKFTEALSKCFRKYSTFKGRAGKSEFWWFFLLWFLFAWPLLLTTSESDTAVGYRVLSLLYFVLTLSALLPFLAVMSRRLHDVNRSAGWMVLLIIALISARLLFAFTIITLPVFAIVIGVCLSILFFMLIPKGNQGPNRFGDPDNDPYTPIGIRTKISRQQLKEEKKALKDAEKEVESNV